MDRIFGPALRGSEKPSFGRWLKSLKNTYKKPFLYLIQKFAVTTGLAILAAVLCKSEGKVVLDVYVGNLSGRVSADDLRELFDGVLGRNTFGLRKATCGLRKATWTNALIALLGRASWAQSVLSRLQKIPQDTELSFKMVDAAQGQSTRYCLVSGYTRSSATRLIRQLEGAGLQGRALDVHPFQQRISNSDPRRAGWRFHRWLGVERRVTERRYEK